MRADDIGVVTGRKYLKDKALQDCWNVLLKAVWAENWWLDEAMTWRTLLGLTQIFHFSVVNTR